MNKELQPDFKASSHIFSLEYWREAARQLQSTRMLVFAALIIALRVAIKPAAITVTSGVKMTFDCYVNSLGSMIYGPVVALLVGAISDTLGCLLFPSGAYFLPFILVEMSSSFIFALFFWRRQISVPRTLWAKFTVNFICNILLTSIFQKWYYIFFGMENAETYAVINGARIVKNLAIFPVEAILIVTILNALILPLKTLHVLPSEMRPMKMTRKYVVLVIGLLLLSIGLIFFYAFWLKDFIKANNFEFWI